MKYPFQEIAVTKNYEFIFFFLAKYIILASCGTCLKNHYLV